MRLTNRKYSVLEIIVEKNIKFYLSNNIKLALNLGLNGAYFPSFNTDLKHLSYSLPKNFKILGSAHSKKKLI